MTLKLSFRGLVLATSLGLLAVASLLLCLVGLWGQRRVFWENRQVALVRDGRLLDRVFRDRELRLAEYADSLTEHDQLIASMASAKVDAIEEYAAPILNRLDKQGVSSLRLFSPDGRLLYQAGDGTAQGVDTVTAAAIRDDKRASGMLVEDGKLLIATAMPVYRDGDKAGIIWLGSPPDRTLKGATDLLGNLMAIYVRKGRDWTLQSATDPTLFEAFGRPIGNKDAESGKVLGLQRVSGRDYVLALVQLPGVNGALILEATDVSQVQGTIRHAQTFAALCALLLLLIGGVAGWMLLSLRLAPLYEIARALDRVAHGDLSRRVRVDREDEIGSVANSANRMIDEMHDLLERLAKAMEAVRDASNALTQLSHGASGSIAQVVQGMSQISQSASELAAVTQSAAKLGQDTGMSADRGRKATAEVVLKMAETRKAVETSTRDVAELGRRSQEIGQIIDVITKIADQTNLLSLNAAIEAARAGESGRGFAVVADEVRKLAETSSQSANRIIELVREVQARTSSAITAVEGVGQRVARGHQLVQEADAIFEAITSGVRQLAEKSAQLASTTEEIAAATEEATASGEEQSAMAEKVATSAQSLSNVVDDLTTLVARFKIR